MTDTPDPVPALNEGQSSWMSKMMRKLGLTSRVRERTAATGPTAEERAAEEREAARQAAEALRIKQALQAKHDQWKDYFKSWFDWDTSTFIDPTKSALEDAIAEVKTVFDATVLALAGDDTDAHQAQSAAFDEASAKSLGWRALYDAAQKAVAAHAATQAGASPRQAEAMGALHAANPAAYNAALALLQGTAAALGGATMTKDLVAEKNRANSDAWDAYAAAKGQFEAAAASHSKAVAARKRTAQRRDGFKAQIAALKAEDAEANKDEIAALEVKLAEQRAIYTTRRAAAVEKGRTKDRRKAAMDTKSGEWVATRDAARAADAQFRLMEAITFGPLCPDHGNAITGEAAEKLIKTYAIDPVLADRAVGTAARAPHPGNVANAALLLAGRCGYELKSADGSDKLGFADTQAYARNIIDVIGHYPPEMAGRFEAYIDSEGAYTDWDDCNPAGFNKKTRVRTQAVTDYLLEDDGTVDIAGGVVALMDVMFHPRAVSFPRPELANHMYETLVFLDSTPEAVDKIQAMGAPTSSTSKKLLARATGKDQSAIGKADAQKAVLNAMLTPVFQGEVGSCFATSGIVKLRETDPLRALDTYADVATKGLYTPAFGPRVRVVTNVPADEDPLVRSLEYSAATATARAANSTRKTALNGQNNAGMDKLRGKIKSRKWAAVKQKLRVEAAKTFTFVYNPEVAVDLSADGSSDHGRYELVTKAGRNPVNSRREYLDAVKPLADRIIRDRDLKDGVSKSDIAAVFETDEFLDAIRDSDGKLPWELPSGGSTSDATKVIFGASVTTSEMVPEGTGTGPGARTKAILSGMLTKFAGSAEEMVTVKTSGIHGFNLLPNHPSLDTVKDPDPAKAAANLDRALIDKGQEIKDRDIPQDEAVRLFERQIQILIDGNDVAEAERALKDGLAAHRPAEPGPHKPAAIDRAVKDATAQFVTKRAKAKADAWKARQDTPPSDDAYDKQLAKQTRWAQTRVDKAQTTEMLETLGAPQFVIADTNWGDGQTRTFFVVAPDPATGEPRMFKRQEPPVTLQPVEDKWVNAEWATIQ